MMSTIDEESFFTFRKNAWLGDWEHHVTNDDSNMFEVTNIDDLVLGSSGSMRSKKCGMLHIYSMTS